MSSGGKPRRWDPYEAGPEGDVETFTTVCPEISRDTARDLAAFCKG